MATREQKITLGENAGAGRARLVELCCSDYQRLHFTHHRLIPLATIFSAVAPRPPRGSQPVLVRETRVIALWVGANLATASGRGRKVELASVFAHTVSGRHLLQKEG